MNSFMKALSEFEVNVLEKCRATLNVVRGIVVTARRNISAAAAKEGKGATKSRHHFRSAAACAAPPPPSHLASIPLFSFLVTWQGQLSIECKLLQRFLLFLVLQGLASRPC